MNLVAGEKHKKRATSVLSVLTGILGLLYIIISSISGWKLLQENNTSFHLWGIVLVVLAIGIGSVYVSFRLISEITVCIIRFVCFIFSINFFLILGSLVMKIEVYGSGILNDVSWDLITLPFMMALVGSFYWICGR